MRKRDPDRDRAGQQRSARAVDHAGENVAAEFVGAEPVQRGRRLAHQRPARRDRLIRRDQRREHREQDESCDHDKADHRALALEQTPQRAPRRALQFVGDGNWYRAERGVGHGLRPQPRIDEDIGDIGDAD